MALTPVMYVHRKHPGHVALEGLPMETNAITKGLYQYLNSKGVYINAPDWYFLDGSNKIALGYREVNFSLSRISKNPLTGQNIYDGTWDKTPSMGWGFVPLTKYQVGGPETVLEPLHGTPRVISNSCFNIIVPAYRLAIVVPGSTMLIPPKWL